jgi:syntaxin 1B/2/3
MSVLVAQADEQLDTIQHNAESIDQDMEQGNKQIDDAIRLVRRRRKMRWTCFIIILIIIIIIAALLAIYFTNGHHL